MASGDNTDAISELRRWDRIRSKSEKALQSKLLESVGKLTLV